MAILTDDGDAQSLVVNGKPFAPGDACTCLSGCARQTTCQLYGLCQTDGACSADGSLPPGARLDPCSGSADVAAVRGAFEPWMNFVRFSVWSSIAADWLSDWLPFPSVADALQHMRRTGANVMEKQDAFVFNRTGETLFRFGTASSPPQINRDKQSSQVVSYTTLEPTLEPTLEEGFFRRTVPGHPELDARWHLVRGADGQVAGGLESPGDGRTPALRVAGTYDACMACVCDDPSLRAPAAAPGVAEGGPAVVAFSGPQP